MQIFKNRILFCANMLFIAFSVVFFVCGDMFIFGTFCICTVLICVCMLLLLLRKINFVKIFSLVLCLIFIITSSVVSHMYFDVVYEKYGSIDEGSSCKVEAVVISSTYSVGGSSEYTLRVERLDGKSVNVKSNLKCEYIANLAVGNRIQGTFSVGRFEEKIGSYRESDMMLAEGVLLCMVSKTNDDFSIIAKSDFSVSVVFSKINSRLATLMKSVFGREVGGVSSAIFLGNKSVVPKNVSRDFSRAGASHILAISGMHMGIIFGFLDFIFKRAFIPCKIRAGILSVCAVTYLIFTGFSVSATRSVIMLIVVYLSMILSHSADPLTSLSIAGVFILAISPNAVADAGFWMSFCSTFGILVFIPPLQQFLFEKTQSYYSKWKIVIKPIKLVINLIATSICAIIPLIVVFAIFTKEMPVFSVLSSLVLSLPTEGVLILTPTYLAFRKVPVLGKCIGILLKSCCEFMLEFCKRISERNDCIISFNYDFVLPLATVLLAIFFVCLLLKFKHRIFSFVIIAVSACLFFVPVLITSYEDSQYIRISYVNESDNRNMILATNGDETVLFDITPGYYSSINCAYDEMSKLNVTEIDCYVITGYTTAHISSLSKSFKSQRIRRLYAPIPSNQDEYFRMMSIMDCAKNNDVPLVFYNDGEVKEFIRGLDTQICREYISRSTSPIVMISCDTSGGTLTYLSSSFVESDAMFNNVYDIMERTDYLIFGSREPSPKNTYKIRNGTNLKEIIFSTDEVASYYDETSFVLPNTKLILSPQIYRYKFGCDNVTEEGEQ